MDEINKSAGAFGGRLNNTTGPGHETRVQRIQRERQEQTGGQDAGGDAPRPVFAHELVAIVDRAIAEYGEYTYTDKGTSEVIDVDPIIARLEEMNAATIRALLVEFIETKGERLAEPLASSLVHGLDLRPDFDDIVDHDLIGPLY